MLPDLSAGGLIVCLPFAVFPDEGLKLLVGEDGNGAVGADHDSLEMFQGGLQFGGLEFGPGIGVRSGWGREIVGFLEGAGGGKALDGSEISLLQGPTLARRTWIWGLVWAARPTSTAVTGSSWKTGALKRREQARLGRPGASGWGSGGQMKAPPRRWGCSFSLKTGFSPLTLTISPGGERGKSRVELLAETVIVRVRSACPGAGGGDSRVSSSCRGSLGSNLRSRPWRRPSRARRAKAVRGARPDRDSWGTSRSVRRRRSSRGRSNSPSALSWRWA